MKVDYNSSIIPGGSFTWGEMALLPQWGRYVEPTPQQFESAVFLAKQFQPVRAAWEQYLRDRGFKDGLGIIITSGARTSEYTSFLRKQGYGAAMLSAHNRWQAWDLVPMRGGIPEFWMFVRKRWKGRMESLAATYNSKTKQGWVHVDTLEWGKSITFMP